MGKSSWTEPLVIHTLFWRLLPCEDEFCLQPAFSSVLSFAMESVASQLLVGAASVDITPRGLVHSLIAI